MALETFSFDAADSLDTPEAQAELLAEALASGDAEIVKAALGIIARARGVSEVARQSGMSREAIYKATGAKGNPTLVTILGILDATGLKLSASVR